MTRLTTDQVYAGSSPVEGTKRAPLAQWQSAAFTQRRCGGSVPPGGTEGEAEESKRRVVNAVQAGSSLRHPPQAGLPEWSKGSDCKSDGAAYVGPNPTPGTIWSARGPAHDAGQPSRPPADPGPACAVAADCPAGSRPQPHGADDQVPLHGGDGIVSGWPAGWLTTRARLNVGERPPRPLGQRAHFHVPGCGSSAGLPEPGRPVRLRAGTPSAHSSRDRELPPPKRRMWVRVPLGAPRID